MDERAELLKVNTRSEPMAVNVSLTNGRTSVWNDESIVLREGEKLAMEYVDGVVTLYRVYEGD